MDLKLTDYDLDITDGDLSWVDDMEAVRQDIEMVLRTFLGESPYDKAAGVPYKQIIFQRGTTPESIYFVIQKVLLDIDFVTAVLELNIDHSRETRKCSITGRVQTTTGEVDFATGTIA